MATEVRDFSTQLRQEHAIPLQDAGLMVFPRSPSRVHCGALCSIQRAFCKTFFFDQVNEKCFLWDKTFGDSCGTNTTPLYGVQSYDFSFIGKKRIWKYFDNNTGIKSRRAPCIFRKVIICGWSPYEAPCLGTVLSSRRIICAQQRPIFPHSSPTCNGKISMLKKKILIHLSINHWLKIL